MGHAPAVAHSHAFLQVVVVLHLDSVMAEMVNHQLANVCRGDRRFHESFLSRCLVAWRMGHLEFFIGIWCQTACPTPFFRSNSPRRYILPGERACDWLLHRDSCVGFRPGLGGDVGMAKLRMRNRPDICLSICPTWTIRVE